MPIRARTRSALGLAVTISLLSAVLAPASATAATGVPRVIAGVHADLVSVGFADGAPTLGSTAAVDGELAKALDPASTVFNVENAARMTIGRGSDLLFLGDLGNTFWIAPQSTPDGALLWPGINTENIAPGAVDDDSVDITLAAVDGPGFLSVYQTNALGTHTRLLDSRDGSGYDTWRMTSGQHQHANWAFSAAGDYTLTFTATVTVQGTPRTVAQDYSMFVGNMLPAAPTTISAPAPSATTITAGEDLTLTATVTPTDAPGTVSFSTGTSYIADASNIDGTATITTSTLPLGRQTISARFTPDSEDDFAESVSAPTIVTVTSPRAEGSFGIAPLAASYIDGTIVTMIATGEAPASDENYQWVTRLAGTGDTWQSIFDDLTYRAETGPAFTREITTDYNGYEFALQIQKSHLILAQSAPVALLVTGESTGSGLEVRIEGVKPVFDYAEYAELHVAGVDLPARAHYEWFLFYPRSNNPYLPTDLGDPEHSEEKTFYVPNNSVLPIGVRIIGHDGTVLGTSPRYTLVSEDAPTTQLEGIKSFYHPGESIALTATVTPADTTSAQYRWSIYSATGERTVIDGATGSTVSIPASLQLNKATISVVLVEPTRGEETYAYAGEEIIVLDPEAADRVYFNPLARHYHSGDAIKLHLVSSSASPTDTYRWYLQRSDQSAPVLIPDAVGADHQLTAEVALASAKVTAELVDKDGTLLAAAEPAHIAVDDHGNPPARHLTVTADAATYPVGATAVLTAIATPASILDRYEWWVQRTADELPVLIAVTRNGTLSIPIDASLDGAALSARLTKETGQTYIQSEDIKLVVTASAAIPAAPDAMQPPPIADPATATADNNSSPVLAATGYQVDALVAAASLLLSLGVLGRHSARRRRPE